MSAERRIVSPEQAGQTLAAHIRNLKANSTWSQARRFIASRAVRVNSELCLDPARRLKAGDVVELLGRPERLPTSHTADLVIRHLDEHVVVVEKSAGISTVRHPAERNWNSRRRALSPTLE